jgi:FkbM family methyltransferase
MDSEREMGIVRRLVAPGDRVVDIGANYGLYTLLLSRLAGSKGKVYSIEPVPWTCDILEFGARRLGLSNVEVIRSAIGAADGSGVMEVPRYEWGGENFYRATLRRVEAGGLRRFSVSLRSLDSLFTTRPGRITFIKCDAEGAELDCVRGGIGLIRSSRPALMIELTDDPGIAGSPAHRLIGLLRDEGYGVYALRGETLKKDSFGGDSINYFFLADCHLAAVKETL